jgi:hypothetical protein
MHYAFVSAALAASAATLTLAAPTEDRKAFQITQVPKGKVSFTALSSKSIF